VTYLWGGDLYASARDILDMTPWSGAASSMRVERKVTHPPSSMHAWLVRRPQSDMSSPCPFSESQVRGDTCVRTLTTLWSTIPLRCFRIFARLTGRFPDNPRAFHHPQEMSTFSANRTGVAPSADHKSNPTAVTDQDRLEACAAYGEIDTLEYLDRKIADGVDKNDPDWQRTETDMMCFQPMRYTAEQGRIADYERYRSQLSERGQVSYREYSAIFQADYQTHKEATIRRLEQYNEKHRYKETTRSGSQAEQGQMHKK